MYAAAFTSELAAQRRREIAAEVRSARLARTVRDAGPSPTRVLTSPNRLHQVFASLPVGSRRWGRKVSVPTA